MGAMQFGLLLLGFAFAVLVLYVVLRRRAAAAASQQRNEPAFIGSEMTDFVSHLHRTPPEMEPLDIPTEAAETPSGPVISTSTR